MRKKKKMVSHNDNLDPEMQRFDDYLRFGTDEERSKDTRTRQAYIYTVQTFKKFLEGQEPTTALAKSFIRKLEENGNGPTSINRHIWALKSYFRFLAEQMPDGTSESERIARHLRIRGLKTPEKLPRFLQDAEWRQLLGVATQPLYDPGLPDQARLRARKELALLYIFGGAGLRLSEGINLHLDDIMDDGYLRVMRKNGHEDYVPIEPEVLQGLKDYLAVRPVDGQFLFSGKEPDTHMSVRHAQQIIKELADRAGLEGVHVHSLRHTVGYSLRKLGASERDIQDVLGHKNISTTRIYTHLLNEDLKSRLPRRFNQVRQQRFTWEGTAGRTNGKSPGS